MRPFEYALAVAGLVGLFVLSPLRAEAGINPEFGGYDAPDPETLVVELKAQKIWAKLQRDIRTCLDKGAKNHARGKDTRLAACMAKVRVKFDAKLSKLDLPECWDADALFSASETEAKDAFARIYCDENDPAIFCGDGELAEWEECDDGNTLDGDCCSSTCTFEAAGSTCPADSNECTIETCDGAGTCVSDPREGSCDDGLFCTATDVCSDGVCQGAGDPCAGGDTCNDDCDETADSCVETGTPCEDGIFCTGNDTCQAGVCVGGPDPCAGGEACQTTCNEAEFHCFTQAGTGCVGGECDGAGVCVQEQGGPCAVDGECQNGTCIDGFCCDSTCGGGCEACAGTLTGAADGTCAPILAGLDPDDECRLPGGVDVCDGSGGCTECGNGVLEIGEACDDNNLVSGDCCSSTCQIETEIPGCAPAAEILTPSHGAFSEASTVVVEGSVSNIHPDDASLTVAGSPVAVASDLSFSTTVSLDPESVFQPIVATLTRTTDGATFNDRVVMLKGAAVEAGDLVTDGIGMRLTDAGLDAIEPAVTGLVEINPKDMIPDGTLILDDYCYQDTIFGCLGRIDVSVQHTETMPGISAFGIAIDSQAGFVEGDITLNDLAVRARVQSVTGIGISCTIDINSAVTNIDGDYTLEPMAGSPSSVDVAQQGGVAVAIGGFSSSTNCGGLLGGLIEWLIGLFMGDIDTMVSEGFQDFLDAVDGDGNTPIAGAIEAALGGIDIAGPVGDGLGTELTTPFNAIHEDSVGITFPINAGIGTLTPDPMAPDLSHSLVVPTTFPTWPATSPEMGETYGVVLGFAPTTFNQFLMEGVAGGLMRTALTEIDLGTGTPIAINSTVLSVLLPAFASLPPATPLEIRIAPTLAPIVTNQLGPEGELARLQIAHLELQIVQPDAGGAVRLSGAIDLDLGLDLVPEVGGLAISVGSAVPESIAAVLLENPLGVDPAAVEALIPTMIDLVTPQLAGELGGFPLPSFLGVSLVPIEVSRHGDYLAIFANLTP